MPIEADALSLSELTASLREILLREGEEIAITCQTLELSPCSKKLQRSSEYQNRDGLPQ